MNDSGETSDDDLVDPAVSRVVTVPRLMVVGTHRGAGTSTITLGLLSALRNAGVNVAAGNVDLSLVRATHHRRISRRLAHSLDTWALSSTQLLDSFARLSEGSELVIVEGELGLFDERPADCSFESCADLALALKCPIILVIDARGYGESIAALVHGFSRYRADIQLAGVIVNRVRDAAHQETLANVIEELLGVPFLGGVRREELDPPRERTLKQKPRDDLNPSLLPRNVMVAISKIVQSGVDFVRLKEIAESAGALSVAVPFTSADKRRCRIAVADDVAFHLTIQDNLDLIRRAGAELVGFSPIADSKIPARTAAIYLPGGYSHLYAADLQFNRQMLEAIREFVAAGGVLYAEGGAMAYLCEHTQLPTGETYEMVGVIPGIATAVVDDEVQPAPFYCDVAVTRDNILARTGDHFRGYIDPRWVVQLDPECPRCFQLHERGTLKKGGSGSQALPIVGGVSPRSSVLVSTLYAHWGSRPELAKNFVMAAEAYSIEKFPPAESDEPISSESNNEKGAMSEEESA